MKIYVFTCFQLLFTMSSAPLFAETFDLMPKWDSVRVLKNPHKGWYHHYPDNGTHRYGITSDAEIDTFPGLDNIFIRLSWSHFEPAEGKFDWKWIDTIADHWVPKGYQIGIAISAKETGEKYATPEWVIQAGAKGALVGGGGYWEPDYGDPIFLEKLNNFHAALAARYGKKPWLAYVQVGSYGSWGEGHNWPSSNLTYPFTTLKKHIDLYRNNYPGIKICISDDIYSVGIDAADRDKIKKYVEETGLFWTDHSILVTYHAQTFPNSIRSPELFESTWRNRPVQLELEHYHKVKSANLWSVPNGSVTGATMLKGAIEQAHPTYVGYHGYAKEWQSENPKIASTLANKIGYWYFPSSVVVPENSSSLNSIPITMTWINRGVAPAYQKYSLLLKLENANRSAIQVLSSMDNTKWMPGTSITETYSVLVPTNLTSGEYKMSLSMQVDTSKTSRKVEIGLNETLRDTQGFYEIGKVKLTSTGIIRPPKSQGKFLNIPEPVFKAYDLTGREYPLPSEMTPGKSTATESQFYFLRAKE